jgi:hypothetical protein
MSGFWTLILDHFISIANQIIISNIMIEAINISKKPTQIGVPFAIPFTILFGNNDLIVSFNLA